MIKIPYLQYSLWLKTYLFNGLWTSRVHILYKHQIIYFRRKKVCAC